MKLPEGRLLIAIGVIAVVVPLFCILGALIVVLEVLPQQSTIIVVEAPHQQGIATHNDSRPTTTAITPGLPLEPVIDQPQIINKGENNNAVSAIEIILILCLIVFVIIIVVGVCLWAHQGQNQYSRHEDNVSGIISDNTDAGCSIVSLKGNQLDIGSTNTQLVTGVPSHIPNVTAIEMQISSTVESPVISDSQSLSYPYSHQDQLGNISVTSIQNYGTYSRGRLMSLVDEDGFHIDDLGFDLNPSPSKVDEESINFEESENFPRRNRSDSYGDILRSCSKLELELNCPISPESSKRLSVIEKGSLSPLGSPTEISRPTTPTTPTRKRLGSLKRQITRSDSSLSLEGLATTTSFNNYLSLVRVDSLTSFDSSALQEALQKCESIKEVDEHIEDNKENFI